jgi:bifunctional UDP-N-acetylglucosamine pyrophosphorylase/glucosamine-1-phosphate N-acetyltransferase
MSIPLTAVILAAGLGTRMKSRKAKVLHQAGGLTLVEHVVRSALAVTTAERVITVIGHQAEHVRKTLASYDVRFAEQTEQKGTGHALLMCREAAVPQEGLLVVLYGDCPLLSADTLRTLLARHSQSGSAATVITAELEDPTGYGRIITDDHGFVQAIVEQKVATPEQRAVRQINSGIYCFDASLLWKHLSEVEPNPISREYYLTDIVEILNRSGHKVSALLHTDAKELLGINTRVELAAADRVFRLRKADELMLAGVTVERPETVTIDVDVTVGMDTVIEPFTRLLGRTTIGADCRIGAGSILQNCDIADGVGIAPYTLMESSRVETGATIGPFARLRGVNHVESNAHIGNFVELKKTNMGRGAKAGHLAYLGDSTIGGGSNIGAGTITCNYDGILKHQTLIGEGAFVGSNSTLVAPVEIGKEAYIAAGSVITQAVPQEALALGRSRQVNKDGWVRRRRKAKPTAAGPSGQGS